MILDVNGKPVTAPVLREKSAYATHSTIGGMFFDTRNPDDVAENNGLDYYDLVARNPMIAGALETRIRGVTALWESARSYQTDEVVPQEYAGQILTRGKTPQEQDALDFVRWNIDEGLERGWDIVLESLLRGSLKKGFAVLETIWDYKQVKRFGGKWYIKDIKERNPAYFRYHHTDHKWYLKRNIYDYDGSFPCDPLYFTFFSYQTEYENEYGQSLLRTLVKLDHFERNAWAFWMILLERFGVPPVLAKVPSGTSDAVRNKLLTIINQFRVSTGVVIDDDQAFELLEATRQGEAGFQALLTLIHKIYAIVITGNALTLEAGDIGSHALAENTTAVIREDILRSSAAALDRCVSYSILYRLAALNYANLENYPFQRLLPPKQPTYTEQDLLVKAQRDTFIVNMGIPIDKAYFYKTYRLPPPVTTAKPSTFAEDDIDGWEWQEDAALRDEAADELEKKPVILREQYDALSASEKRKYFTMANVSSLIALEVIRNLFADAMRTQRPLTEVQADIAAYFDKHPASGEIEISDVGMVFEVQSSEALHDTLRRWAAMPDSEIEAFEYVTMRDDRVRPTHAALDGMIRPVDDEIWMLYTPPIDYNCRCRLEPVSVTMRTQARYKDTSTPNVEIRTFVEEIPYAS
jgi:SPP1 gp7 family putative phage head morphogenesis protein